MSKRFHQSLPVVLLLAIGMIIGFTANSVVAQTPPPTATPLVPPSPGNQPSIDFQTLVGHGADVAPFALQTALSALLFHGHLPHYLPQSMKLYNATVQLIGADRAHGNLDLYYTGAGKPEGRIDLHIYETNQSAEKKSEQTSEIKQMNIGSDIWSYQLLSYPQPDGSTFKLHNLRRTLDNGIYIDADIGVGSTPNTTLAELIKVVSSLQ